MGDKVQASEEKIAGASYILSFYQEVAALTGNFANYENLLLELKQRYGNDSEKMTIEEQDLLKQYCQMLRYYARVCYVKYSAISKAASIKTDQELGKLFTKIKDQYVIRLEDAEKYITKLNSVIIGKIVKRLLENSQDIVNQLYKEGESTANAE